MDVENLTIKYNISESALDHIIKTYGSMEKFKEAYIEAFINGKIDELDIQQSVKDKLIRYFDLSERDGIGRKNGYYLLNNFLYKKCDGQIVNENNKKNLYRVIESLEEKQKNIIKLRCGFETGKPWTLSKIAEQYNCTRETIRIKQNKALNIIKASDLLEKDIFWNGNIELLAKKYFSENDIFYNKHNIEKDKKAKLISSIFESEIDSIEFKEDLSFITQILQIKDRLKNSDLAFKYESVLLNKLNQKKNTIISENNEQYIKAFEYKIAQEVQMFAKEDIMQTEEQLLEKRIQTEQVLNDISVLIKKSELDIKSRIQLTEIVDEKKEFVSNIYKEKLVKIYTKELSLLEKMSTLEVSSKHIKTAKQTLQKQLADLENKIQAMNIDKKTKFNLLKKCKEKKYSIQYEYEQKFVKAIEQDISSLVEIDIYKQPIEILNLSMRTYNRLKRMNICTIDQLVSKPKGELKQTKTIGTRTYHEIIEKIKFAGIKINEDEDENKTLGYNKEHTQMRIQELEETIKFSDIDEENKICLLHMLDQKTNKSFQEDKTEQSKEENELKEQQKEDNVQQDKSEVDNSVLVDNAVNKSKDTNSVDLNMVLESAITDLKSVYIKLNEEVAEYNKIKKELEKELSVINKKIENAEESKKKIQTIEKQLQKLR